jgi:hypothetical protein
MLSTLCYSFSAPYLYFSAKCPMMLDLLFMYSLHALFLSIQQIILLFNYHSAAKVAIIISSNKLKEKRGMKPRLTGIKMLSEWTPVKYFSYQRIEKGNPPSLRIG